MLRPRETHVSAYPETELNESHRKCNQTPQPTPTPTTTTTITTTNQHGHHHPPPTNTDTTTHHHHQHHQHHYNRREQLLTDSPTRPLASSLIVVKGLLNRRGVLGVARGETGAAYCPPTEWMLVVSKLEGTLVRFVAGGVDLIEPDTGDTQGDMCVPCLYVQSFFSTQRLQHTERPP